MRSRPRGREEPHAPIRLLQATAFVSTLDRFAMPPMLVVIAHDLGVPLADVVRAAGIYFFAYGLSQPLWGAVSDRLGRVRTMRLTLLMAALCTLGSALSGSTAVLAVLRSPSLSVTASISSDLFTTCPLAGTAEALCPLGAHGRACTSITTTTRRPAVACVAGALAV